MSQKHYPAQGVRACLLVCIYSISAGADTLTIRNTGGTDHLPFDAVGLPGFQFIQDRMDYGSRTHHSNVDDYDRVFPADMMQASAIIASLAYHAANREEMFPRKPLPLPVAERFPAKP